MQATSLNELLNIPEGRTRQEKLVEMKRLSSELGKPVYFKIRGLDFDDVARLSRKGDEMNLYIVLNGVAEPDLHSAELTKKYSADTPVEAIKKMFLAGEIEDLARSIEVLSGYRSVTVEEVKKK